MIEGNCQSTFDHQDFRRFNIFHIHNQHLGTQFQTRTTSGQPCTSNYVYEDDDWGGQEQSYEQEPDTYEQKQDVWDTEDQNQDDENQDEYQTEHEEAECNVTHQSSQNSDDQDEDDQDNYE